MKVSRFADVAEFLGRAQPWLLEREAEHNLILGVAGQLLTGKHRYQKPVYLAAVEDDGAVCGCAFRTPPFKLSVTSLPLSAIPPLVADVAEVYQTIPAILGPEQEATEFAARWTARVGGSFAVGMRQRIHVLTEVVPPPAPPPGQLRLAEATDVPLIVEWTDGFLRDTGLPDKDHDALARRVVDDRAFFLWVDGEPCSMAAAVAPTPNGIRIGYVYTPPECRGQGYASAAVASLTQHLLEKGRMFCFLYTDLANPTSNAIYRRLGYVPVRDVIDVVFAER